MKMRRKDTEGKKTRKKRTAALAAVLLLCAVILAAAFMIYMHIVSEERAAEKAALEKETVVTVGSAGDVMLHQPFYRSSAYVTDDGDRDFTDCFKYIADEYSEPSYMAVNLETTLPGKEKGYSGYPMFRSPDSLADSLSSSGADLLLLANNHIYDSGRDGLMKTMQTLDEKGIDRTGARLSAEEKPYMIKNIDGIKIGFINYTYETVPHGTTKGLNGNPVDAETAELLNSFYPPDRESFYVEMEQRIGEMKDDGAEFIIAYLHWGTEYDLEGTDWQREMAQRFCDMGVDALIGSHPHVVQPVDVFTSENGHKMFCAFSLGNQLSNQRRSLMRLSTGHTEDGLIVDLEITKKGRERPEITDVTYIPTWVYRDSSGPVYYIIPTGRAAEIEAESGISGLSEEAAASEERTYAIIGDGMEKVREAYGHE